MNKIKILPEILANQIAAGEVVERPASVVKELIENSLDAGAKRIKVEIESGGRRLMKVSDDGCGMSREDAVNCFERHATSKIRTLEDLSRIQTLGFRGEALASIASVAKVELITKTEEDNAATRVLIEGSRLIDVHQAAHPTGTTIVVRDLFFNTPARRKFMRSDSTENYHITAVVQRYALAYPEVSFFLVIQGREVLGLAPAKNLKERIFQIFGAELVENLLPVEGENGLFAKVHGFVSAPHERRSDRDHQFFFVNRRFVRDRVIQSAVAEAFRSVLPHGTYPVAFIFLQVPYEEIDVNVHPAKIEVRFRRTETVKETITQTIRQSLGLFKNLAKPKARELKSTDIEERKTQTPSSQVFPTPQVSEIQTLQIPEEPSGLLDVLDFLDASSAKESERSSQIQVSNFKQIAKTAGEKLRQIEQTKISEIVQKADVSDAERRQNIEKGLDFSVLPPESAKSESEISSAIESEEAFKIPLPSIANRLKPVCVETLQANKIVPLGQIRDSYIVAVDNQGLLLIDQHVAHERILFEKFRSLKSKLEIQNLLIPETVELSPAQVEIFALAEEELEKFGFRTAKLSGRTIAVMAAPAEVPPSEVRSLFLEILSAASSAETGERKTITLHDNLVDEIAARMACKAAIKVNTRLTTEKMQWLIDNLLHTDSPATCPHGRPIILRLTIKDIEKGFHRT